MTAVLLVGAPAAAAPNSADVDVLNLPKDHRCGEELIAYRPYAAAQERTLFGLMELHNKRRVSWRQSWPCLMNLVEAGLANPGDEAVYSFARDQILYLLAYDRVRFYTVGDSARLRLADITDDKGVIAFDTFDRVYYANDFDLAYNAMSQVELGLFFITASEKILQQPDPDVARAEEFLTLGKAVLDVVLDPSTDNGLRTRIPCDLDAERDCSFFHGVTSINRDDPRKGGTLNKHFKAMMNLLDVATSLKRVDALRPELGVGPDAERYEKAAVEGYNQLIYSSGNTEPERAPNFIDFMAKDEDGRPIRSSWLYYSINQLKQRPYFLKKHNKHRNCAYHIVDLTMFDKVLTRMPDYVDLEGILSPRPDLDDSLLGFIVGTYVEKLDDGGIYTDSETVKGGNYLACREDHKAPMDKDALNRLTDLVDNAQPAAAN
ncbi:hypothetical protein [Bauldia sp.]|uniref:hypothetical protein n=1 Tax=Bauldia sp. TaxID=2575872 RepID=UPI003BA8E18A